MKFKNEKTKTGFLQTSFVRKNKVFVLLLIIFFAFINGLQAQTGAEHRGSSETQDSNYDPAYNFPSGDFWSLDGGLGISGILVEGMSYQLVIDPKLWLSPVLMVGAKAGINYSTESEHNLYSNILTFEGQVYLRWNFLRLGKPENTTNIFFQAGLGLIAAYRGATNPLDDVTVTRGSILGDAALGITIPLTKRWHLEPLVRGGYPHIFGFSLTAGYKFPLPEKTIYQREEIVRTQEIVKTMAPNEIIKIIRIASIEFVLFGPDIGRYNIGIDRDAQQLNELILIQTAKVLRENPDFRVRLEGHANPFTINISEAEDLMALSAMRAETIAQQLRERGVSEEQMVVVSFGGTRTATSEWDLRNRNRRVELMIIQVDTD
ncbi:MAG: OmpA family protein [Treponema sp.]|nr:OmpA family protein [Treponema sp.]MCL2252272.1 OmpA family protein [Treponema sp.]